MIKRFDAPYEGVIEIECGEYVEYKDHEGIVKGLRLVIDAYKILSEENIKKIKELEESNRNCISLYLHESRMANIQVKLTDALWKYQNLAEERDNNRIELERNLTEANNIIYDLRRVIQIKDLR